MPFARRRREGGELRHAFCLRANQSVPNRRLDRTSLAREIFSEETKSDQREPGGIRCQLFRHARRLCAAVSISPCEDDGEEATERMIAEFVAVEAGVPTAIG